MKKASIATIKHLTIQGGLALGLLISNVRANETSNAQFLKLGAGARAAGMADAFSSVANDVTASYWNPAGLAQLETPEISVMQNNQLLDTQYQYFGGAIPMRKQTFAFSIYRMNYGSIDRYTELNAKDGSFTAGSLAGSLSFGQKVNEHLSAGVSLKYIQESLEAEKASSFAADFGALFHQGEMNYGAMVQHVGPGLKFVQEKGSLPQTVRAGASRYFFQKNLLVALDLSKPKDNDTTFHGGLEYNLNPTLTLRGGYQVTSGNSLDVGGLTGVTGGIGINLGRFSFDYGFVPFGDLGSTHRVSLLLHFNKL